MTKLTNQDILTFSSHRSEEIPLKKWQFYQEWNEVIFLHWKVSAQELKAFVPEALEIDVQNGYAWVSLVAFTMEKTRHRLTPAFPPISNFHEINIRTYVRYKGVAGVYFMNMEAAKKVSTIIAKRFSGLPYQHANMKRTSQCFWSKNEKLNDHFFIKYNIDKTPMESDSMAKWLTERYAVFEAQNKWMMHYQVHHLPWPLQQIKLEKLALSYPTFEPLINNKPDLVHFSKGVQVLTWPVIKHKLSNNHG